jgi:hypothetical protein
MVESHEKFAALDGVGGLLRYKLQTDLAVTAGQ